MSQIITPRLKPDGLSAATLDRLRLLLPEERRSSFTNPLTSERVLTPGLITDFAEKNYNLAWKKRKEVSGEVDGREDRRYQKLSAEEIDFTRHLSNGKLCYLVALVTREGLQELIRLGELGQPLSELNFPNADNIRDTLARLHHENWLNLNARLKRVSPWNYEWGKHPPEKAHGYELQRVQVDMDCRALAALSASDRERLLDLATPGNGSDFFHSDKLLSVRSHEPVQASDAGHQFQENRSKAALIELISNLAVSPGAHLYYEIHGILDGLEVSAHDRQIIKKLLYSADGQRISGKESELLLERLKSEDALERSSLTVQDMSPSRESFHTAFPAELLKRWQTLFIPSYRVLMEGFTAGYAARTSEDADHFSFFDSEKSNGVLEYLRSYRGKVAGFLRELGMEMRDNGVISYAVSKHDPLEGVLLYNQKRLVIPNPLLDNLTYSHRRLILSLQEKARDYPAEVTMKRWKPVMMRQYEDPVPSADWKKDRFAIYGLALALSNLEPQDFSVISSACVK